jgi:tetratricopeptide (TPR) repeat protein
VLDSRALRFLAAAGVLVLFYWSLFTGAPPAAAPAAPSAGVNTGGAKSLADEAKSLMRSGDYEKALDPAQKLHEAFPANHIYIDQLATVYHHLKRPKEEAELWEEYLQKAPVPDEACPALGLAYRAQGLEEKARDAFSRCLDLDPTNPDFVLHLALSFERAGRADKASELYVRGLALAPEYSDMRLGLARIDLRAGRAEKAKAAAVRALERSPDNVDALLVAGLACLRLGAADEARVHLERGVRLSPEYTDLVLALAQTSVRQGRVDEARRELARVLELDPENGEALRARERLLGRAP